MLPSTKTTLFRAYLGMCLSLHPLSSHAKILNHAIQIQSTPSISVPQEESTSKKSRKNAKKQTPNKASSTINSENDLPDILYDRQALLDIINEIPMGPPVKEQTMPYLQNIERKVEDIKRYQSKEHIEDFYHPMKEALFGIRNTARVLYELTRPYHLSLSNKLRERILESIYLFDIELSKRMEMSAAEKAALSLTTKRLYAEQSYMVRKKELQQKLIEHLTKLKQLLTEAGNPSPCCYISYAWPTNKNQEQEYWVQPFLSILYDHLTAAGIRVMMDIRDNKPGDDIYKFMEQYHDGNHIILVGTESLLEKHRNIVSHAVKTELSIINNRFEEDQKRFGYSRIYPLLVSGTIKTSFPEIYDKYRTIRDAREAGYLLMLQHLIDWIYEQHITKVEAEYTKLWHTFNKNFPGLPKDADAKLINQELNLGYHRKELDYLKQDTHFQTIQEQANYSSATHVKKDGVTKSQRSDRKHKEYDQQFQRPSITPDFVERQRLWGKIVDHFNQSDQQVLTLTTHGLGGIGKTELAKYYYLHPPKPYALRAWFNAENKEQLYSQYVDLAKANGIEFAKEMPLQEQVQQVKKWLEIQKDCLLIYDNAPNASQIDGLLPEQGGHHILITSRNEMDWPVRQRLDIDVMEEQEAMALISKMTECQEEAPLKKLVKILNCLPLALAQAGAYIAETKTSIEDYLILYQKHQSSLMNDRTLTRNPKHEPVWVTFNMNFKALEAECPHALLTLNQASWLDASVIPEVLLKTMLKGPQGESVDLLWNNVKKHIGRYSLMRIDREGHQLNMHRLVQDILRNKQSKLERKQTLTQVASSIKSIYPENSNRTVENINMIKLLLPHIEKMSSYIKQYLSESEYIDLNLEFNLGGAYESIGNFTKAKEKLQNDLSIKQKQNKKEQIKTKPFTHTNSSYQGIVNTLDHLGDVCSQLAEYQEALNYFQQALTIKRSLYADNHPDIATSLNGIGLVYYRWGKYQEALNYLQQALEIRQSLYTDNHPDMATSLHRIGFVYYRIGKYQEALKYLQQALEMRKSLYDTHPDIAFSLNDVGLVYYRLGNYQQALKYLQQALEIKQTLYSSNHPYTAISLSDLGLVYNRIGKYLEALKYHQRALEIHLATYSENHPYTASSLHNMGSAYYGLGNYQEALRYCEQALKINQNIYLGNHFRIAMSLNVIGEIYHELGHYQKALQYHDQAFQMYQSIYPSDHPSIATAFSSIGLAYFNLGEYQKALQYHQQALGIRQAAYIGKHPSIEISLRNIGLIYQELGNYQEALNYYKQSLSMGQDCYSGNHPHISTALNNIGSVNYFLGNYQEALKYYEQALKIYQSVYSGNHPNIAMALNNIGNVYQTLGELDKALQYYEQALTMRKIIFTSDHPDIATSINNLASVYFNLGEVNKSMELYEQALAIYKTKLPVEHIKISKASTNLGNVLLSLGKYQESKELLEKTLTTITNQFGPQHIFTATVMANLGNTYGLLGDHSQSRKLLENSLEILKAHYKAENADIARVMGNLALLYVELGNSTKGKEYLEKALNIFKKHLHKNHPDIMKTFKELKKFNDTRNRNGKKDRSKVLGYSLIFLF